MNKLLIAVIALTMTAALSARADDAAEKDAIRKRHDEWIAAWNQHDAKLMAAFWVQDGDVINPFGKRAKGQDELQALFAKEQSGMMAGTTYSGTMSDIRFLKKDVAVVDVDAEITGGKAPDGSPMPPFKHHVTWIAEKRNGKWMAVAARAFASLPPPATPAVAN